MLEFLEDAEVGRTPGRVLMAGGPDLEEDEIEVELSGPEKEDEGTGMIESEEESGPGPPL